MTAHQVFIQTTSQESIAFYTSSKGIAYTSCQLVLPSAVAALPVTDSLQQVSEPAQSPCGDNTKAKVLQQRSEDHILPGFPYAPKEDIQPCLSRSLYRNSTAGPDVHIILLFKPQGQAPL